MGKKLAELDEEFLDYILADDDEGDEDGDLLGDDEDDDEDDYEDPA